MIYYDLLIIIVNMKITGGVQVIAQIQEKKYYKKYRMEAKNIVEFDWQEIAL